MGKREERRGNVGKREEKQGGKKKKKRGEKKGRGEEREREGERKKGEKKGRGEKGEGKKGRGEKGRQKRGKGREQKGGKKREKEGGRKGGKKGKTKDKKKQSAVCAVQCWTPTENLNWLDASALVYVTCLDSTSGNFGHRRVPDLAATLDTGRVTNTVFLCAKKKQHPTTQVSHEQ